MKKIILIFVSILVLSVVSFYVTDHILVENNDAPIFVIKTKHFDDKNSYEAIGFGYKVFCYHNELEGSDEYVLANIKDTFDENYFENELIATFYGQVVDTDATTLYITPLLNESERSVSDLFTIDRTLQPQAVIDDYLFVEYKGRISPSYPACVHVTSTKLFPMLSYQVQTIAGTNASGIIQETFDVVTRYFEFQSTLLHASIKESETVKQYDDTYFQEHALLVLQLSENFEGVNHEIFGLYAEEDHFTLEMVRTSPTDGIITPTTYYIFVEVEKELALSHPNITIHMY